MSDCCPESELVDETAQVVIEDDCTIIVEVEAGGPPGPQGDAASIEVGTTTTLPAGSSATVVNSGTSGAAILDFGIPEGAGATIEIGATSTLAPGSPATVINVGTPTNATLDFGIPEGQQGAQGAVGSQGPQGAIGTGATVSVGTTTTLAPGSSATVGNSGTASAAIFDFGIPEGVQGSVGPQGSQGPQGATGQSSSFYEYKIKTTTTSGNPGSGNIIYNNAIQTSATQINVSHLDKQNYDIDVFLALIQDGDKITIQKANSSNDFQQWEITSTPTIQSGYIELPVTLVSSGGIGTTGFSNNEDVILVLSLVGPQGPQGSQGSQGPAGSAATINVGTTTTLAPGSSATVGNSGTTSAAIFDFGIPEGVQGAQGPQGASITGPQGSQGPQGSTGLAATVSVGSTSTLSPGSSATVANSGTSSAAIFDFGIPAGVQGSQGSVGPQGSTGPAGIEVDGTAPVNTAILWADTSEPGDMVLPLGGSTGQVLAKVSASDYDTAWTASLLPTIIDAKGDLIVGTANDTAARLAVGSTANQVLTVDSTTSSGLKWANPVANGAGNQPLNTAGAYLGGSNGLVLSGLTANYGQVPDSNALDITGDIDIRVKASLDDWTPSTSMAFVSKFNNAPQNSYMLGVLDNVESNRLRLWISSNGTAGITATSSASTGYADGSTGWVRATYEVSTGDAKFYTSSDGSTWTQLGTTISTTPTTPYASTTPVQFGAFSGQSFLLKGKLFRCQILSGVGGTTVLDANFETATAGALAFTESSSNAATVSIITTRYTYGLPNVQWQASNATQALTANTVYYQPFLVTAPIIVDATQFHVTSGPASSANVRTGIYLADGNMQPSGAAVLDAGNTVVSTSATGTFLTQFTPVTLSPGMYLTAINTSVALTNRIQRGGIVGTDIAAGTSSIISLMYGSQTQGSFPNPGTAWNTRTFSTTGPNHLMFLRWSAA